MMHGARFIATNAIVCSWVLSGCVSYYNSSNGAATGGTTSTGGTTATGGTTPATGGTTPATGGTSPATGGVSSKGGQTGDTGGTPSGGSGGGSGGGTGEVSCSDVPACGGEVVGTWKAASCEIKIGGMADMGSTGLGCAKAPVVGSLKVSGTWTATADGKFTDATTTTGTAVIELEKACLSISGFGTTCDRIPLDPMGLTSVVCVDNPANEGCTCTATINQAGGMSAITIDSAFNPPEGSSGTYKTAENKLTTTAGVYTEYSYCATGNTLTMNLVTAIPVGTLTGPVVLQKQ
jgi:hypothetical protein